MKRTFLKSVWIRPVWDYCRTWARVVIHSRVFFSRMPIQGSFVPALMFAWVAHGFGTLGDFLWNWAVSSSFPLRFLHLWGFWPVPLEGLWRTAPVIVDPFVTLGWVTFHATTIFIAVRLLAKSQISYELVFRLVCYALAPSLLRAVPQVGNGISVFLSYSILWIAIQAVCHVSAFKSLAILFLASGLFFFTFLGGVFYFLGKFFFL